MAQVDANGNPVATTATVAAAPVPTSTVGSFATPPNSQLNSAPTPRAEVLAAVTAEPEEETAVGSVYPTVASNHIPTPPTSDPSERTADFYRDGKYKESESLDFLAEKFEINPKRFSGWEYDERVASIRLYGAKKGKTEKVDLLPAYTKFFLENVQEGHAEKTQIVETFGKFYVYSFGERPPMYTFSGKLMSTKNADWASDFAFLYDQYLRSTKASELKAQVIITYGGKQVEGLLVAFSTSKQADVEGAVPFQMQMIVFERRFLNFSNDFGFTTGNGKNLNRDEGFQKLLDQVTGGRTGLGTSNPKTSKITEVAKGVVQNTLPAQGPLSGLSGGFGSLA